jgi:hypothetical protein
MGSDMAGKWRLLGCWSISLLGKREDKKGVEIVEIGGQKLSPNRPKG